MSTSNGLMIILLGKYATRKQLYDINSDITDESEKCFYCQSYEDCSICKAFSCLTTICKLGRHSTLKKKPKMKEF